MSIYRERTKSGPAKHIFIFPLSASTVLSMIPSYDTLPPATLKYGSVRLIQSMNVDTTAVHLVQDRLWHHIIPIAIVDLVV
jgi:hypothetical protein